MVEILKLMLNRDSAIVRNMFKICELWSCDMNSTLGSVVPLAMFLDFPQNFKLSTRNQYCPQAIAWGTILDGGSTVLDGGSTIFCRISQFTHFCRNLHYVPIYALFPQFFFGQNSLLSNITRFLHVCLYLRGLGDFDHSQDQYFSMIDQRLNKHVLFLFLPCYICSLIWQFRKQDTLFLDHWFDWV